MNTLYRWAALALLLPGSLTGHAAAASMQDNFDRTPNRIWIGPDYWANPMEDWRVQDGRLECTSNLGNRNVHHLTHQLGARPGSFKMSVRCGVLEPGQTGGAGFLIGVHDDIDDYRGNCLFGKGIPAGIVGNTLVLDTKTLPLASVRPLTDLLIQIEGRPMGDDYALLLTVIDNSMGEVVGALMVEAIPAERLKGNLALVNNFDPKTRNGARFWFDEWTMDGDKIEARPAQQFGPILWSMYSLTDSRGPEGSVMKMTAQMPPLGEADSKTVRLEAERDGQWQTLGEAPIDPDACTATFRIPHWNAAQDTPYRLVWEQRSVDGPSTPSTRAGTIRQEPRGRPLVIGGLTCQEHHAFPYAPVAENLMNLNPDLLFFSGDQIYEGNGGYGIIREPADRAILNFLRKWYLFGWAFGEVMRDRPTLVLPDDHDVFQGNLWGEAGRPMAPGGSASSSGGYIQPERMLHVVHTVSCAHHPDLADPTPITQGLSVYYGDMVYGRVSFAIVGDRQFKSGPEHVDTGGGRADWVIDPAFDVHGLDRPGLQLLGERQERFLADWVRDWRGADMKILLSETVFANAATHHGEHDNRLKADLDSGGWPQSARDRALRIARKGFALHLNGDQHIPTMIQYGVDAQRDSNWSFCTPAISVGYQRWWRPDELGVEPVHRPAGGGPNTGEYLDGFANRIFVQAVGNPTGSTDPNRYRQTQIKASGFGIVRVDLQKRTYTCEAYRFLCDATDGQPGNQFAGWPVTIDQLDNYGRKRIGVLPECTAPEGVNQAVVEVTDEANGELVYAVRIQGRTFAPFVFEPGRYTVRIGDPDRNQWTVLKHQTLANRP